MARISEAPYTPLLTVEDLAHRLKVSEATVYNLLRRGEIPSFRVGRAWRVEETDLNDYIQQRKTRRFERSEEGEN